MPQTKVVLFRDSDGSVPLLDWFDKIPPKAQAKCLVKLERLEQLGHQLRRPEADLLRDKIYELRASYQGVHYRLLYFFHGNIAAVVSHGITKLDKVPSVEINRAIERREKFLTDPKAHTYEE